MNDCTSQQLPLKLVGAHPSLSTKPSMNDLESEGQGDPKSAVFMFAGVMNLWLIWIRPYTYTRTYVKLE